MIDIIQIRNLFFMLLNVTSLGNGHRKKKIFPQSTNVKTFLSPGKNPIETILGSKEKVSQSVPGNILF